MAATEGRNDAVFARYMALESKGKIQAEYVWIGGKGDDLRSKGRTFDSLPASLEDLPEWNFDGSSTAQAEGHDSEVLLLPVKMVPDPFRGAPHIIVLCECVLPDGSPAAKNTRRDAAEIFAKDEAAEPWFGMEQEYTLFCKDGVTPLGWPQGGFPGPQGPYYCGAGTGIATGRQIAEAHYRVCLAAGLDISGINAEVMPGQWEYQIGPVTGVDAGDQMTLSRFFMMRVCEDFQVKLSLDPKPIAGDWNGAGCHVNYSTAAMRAEGGYEVVIAAVKKLEPLHKEFIAAYGEGNERRLTGKHETASMHSFSYGVANRGASVRIPRTTAKDGKGYFEDRRPSSNMDPYLVTSMIFNATHLH